MGFMGSLNWSPDAERRHSLNRLYTSSLYIFETGGNRICCSFYFIFYFPSQMKNWPQRKQFAPSGISATRKFLANSISWKFFEFLTKISCNPSRTYRLSASWEPHLGLPRNPTKYGSQSLTLREIPVRDDNSGPNEQLLSYRQ